MAGCEPLTSSGPTLQQNSVLKRPSKTVKVVLRGISNCTLMVTCIHWKGPIHQHISWLWWNWVTLYSKHLVTLLTITNSNPAWSAVMEEGRSLSSTSYPAIDFLAEISPWAVPFWGFLKSGICGSQLWSSRLRVRIFGKTERRVYPISASCGPMLYLV